mgnify:CR=1 FL=1
MEDRIIKPGLYAYQFRVDLELDDGLTRIMEFIKKYDVKHYIVGAETSDLGKQHFQCILWFAEKINTTKLRNWWKGKTLATKQPVSLTSAKKIKNLGKYTMKNNNFITNLTEEEIKLIGKWDPKVQNAEWTQMLDKHAEKWDDSHVETYQQVSHDTYGYNPNAKLYAFLSYMLDYYKANHKRPSRATLQYIAWKHGHMTNNYLISKWF